MAALRRVTKVESRKSKGESPLRIFLSTFAFLLSTFPFPLSTFAKAPPAGLATPCRVVAVIDGDTIEVEGTQRLRVRLLDCWAPETRTKDAAEKKRGLAAKAHLQKIAAGQDATLWIPAAGARHLGELTTLGRALGHVWLDGDDKNLSERQRAAGHATKNKRE